MTPKQYPTSRVDIAANLSADILHARGDSEAIRNAMRTADHALVTLGYRDDHAWLCKHSERLTREDVAARLHVAQKLIERLHIEGDASAPDLTGRTLDALVADAKRHLAVSGDRRDFAGRLIAHNSGLTIEQHLEQLALLCTDAAYRLVGYAAAVDELNDLRARVVALADIRQAKAEQAVAEAVQA
ncbi:hypothetical protein [Nocardia rhizosphaerae]|uniref:DUF222 domain-containing protein n=1 Tax=Nocardia rhizosphaerae TaxID=1691571 RepID=A0ABV8L212_9NOCA